MSDKFYTSLGGIYDDSGFNYYDEILEFESRTGEWSLIGRMMIARDYHAVSIVSTEEINIYC